MKDGVIDRYSGERLLNPGILKILSAYFPKEFPYQFHWKMTDTHVAYWELIPTIDYVYPIARGGVDDPSNWVTTSMLHNQVKNNWTLDQLNWNLYSAGDIQSVPGWADRTPAICCNTGNYQRFQFLQLINTEK